MALILKQSTAVDVLIGPFLDLTDGATAEEGESPTVLLSKNGQALGAKSDATTPVHDDAGYYNCELDTTDTNTVGTLVLIVEKSATALPVRHEFYVVEEAIYDALFGASAAAFDANQRVDVGKVTGTAQTANDIGADVNDILTDTAVIGALGAGLTAITDKTDLIPADPADQSAVEAAIAAAHVTTDALVTAVDNFVDTEVGAIKGVTDKLDSALELDGAVYRFTTNALEQAPAGGGGGDATLANQTRIIQILTGKWVITGNQLIMYDSDGATPLYTFNLKQDGTPTEFNPDERTPV